MEAGVFGWRCSKWGMAPPYVIPEKAGIHLPFLHARTRSWIPLSRG